MFRLALIAAGAMALMGIALGRYWNEIDIRPAPPQPRQGLFSRPA